VIVSRQRGRRRGRAAPFLWSILLGTALAAGAVRTLPAPLPVEMAPMRTLAFATFERLEPELPEAATTLRRCLAEAEAALSRHRATPFWRRDPDAVVAAWDRVGEEGFVALRRLREHRASVEQQWATLQSELLDAVVTARRQARATGLSPRESSLALQAETAFRLALRQAEAGDLPAAIAAGQQALALAETVSIAWEDLHARFEDRASLSRWERWVRETVADSARRGRPALVVDKLRRRLHLFAGGRRVAVFPVELGVQGLRRKLHAGDRATPEGRYRVVEVKTGGATRFYKALLIDYPNPEDRRRYQEARRQDLIPRGAGVGGLIEIHGDGGRGQDWTDGCVALSNDAMDRLLRHARVGTAVTIVGTIPEGAFDGDP